MTDDPLCATISQRGVVFGPAENDEWERRVLVMRRASDGEWELPGGRLDPGENVIEGLHRELDEEVGFDATVRTPVHTVTWENASGQGRFAVYYYCETEERALSLSEEHDDAEWVPPATARERLSDPQSTAVERALDVHFEHARERQFETFGGDTYDVGESGASR